MGDLPDIQIKHSELIAPLQAVAQVSQWRKWYLKTKYAMLFMLSKNFLLFLSLSASLFFGSFFSNVLETSAIGRFVLL